MLPTGAGDAGQVTGLRPDRGIGADPKLVWDTGPGPYHGRRYAVWTQAAPQNKDDLNVMFQYSGNAGRTWTRPVPLNDAQTAGSSFSQTLALDPATGTNPDGKLHQVDLYTARMRIR